MTEEEKESKMPLTTVRLRVKETKNARIVRMKIRQEDKKLGTDLRRRDYKGADYQSGLIEQNARIEANEDRRLLSLQSEKRDRLLEKQKRKEEKKRLKEQKRPTKPQCAKDEYWVEPYDKKDGTHVKGHCAKLQYDSAPNADKRV
jgi:hypothetical protein